jgi:hypothetical protein
LFTDLAHQLRRTLGAHPGAAVIVATQDVSPQVWEPLVPVVLASLQSTLVVDDETALLLAQSLYVPVTGLALAEFGNAPEPPSAAPEFYDRWFDVAVNTILDRLAARYPTGVVSWPELHARTYARTLIVLPRIGDRPRPNVEHMILHALVLAAAVCTVIATSTLHA